MRKNIVITGGHLTPALAVCEELVRQDWQIIFFGRKQATESDATSSVESRIIPRMGLKFVPLTTGRLQRRLTKHTISSLLKIPIGFCQSFWYLLKFRPSVILSFGGYVSVPVVLMGWLLNIPVVTHEQTTTQGLATKINIFFAQKICVSWEESLKHFPASKAVLTGNPVRKDIFEMDESWFKSLKFKSRKPLIFVTGGNQGSKVINEVIRKSLKKILLKANVFHQVGHLEKNNDYGLLLEAKRRLPLSLANNYQVFRYLTGKQMGTILAKADLVVSRSGANIISELLLLGKPSLLIPFPWLYGNEQVKNALMVKEAGSAEVLFQKDLSSTSLSHFLNKMLGNLGDYRSKAGKARKLVDPKAASKIVKVIEKVI